MSSSSHKTTDNGVHNGLTAPQNGLKSPQVGYAEDEPSCKDDSLGKGEEICIDMDPAEAESASNTCKNEEAGELPQGHKKFPYHLLFRFANIWDIIGIIVGVLAGAVVGSLLPLFLTVFGDMLDDFQTEDEVMDELLGSGYVLLGIALIGLVCGYTSVRKNTREKICGLQ